jgi:DNA-binding XRE family transcriptional regulator
VSMDVSLQENLIRRNGKLCVNLHSVTPARGIDKILCMREPTETHAREAFSERLAAAREAAGFPSKQAMADFLGISQARYGTWERGEGMPNSITLLRHLCDALDVTTDYLFFGRTAGMTRTTYARLKGNDHNQ